MPSVVVVRHALSTWNVGGRWQGRADPPLSAEGEAQAMAAAAALGPVGLVVTSGLRRARRTGQILGGGAPLVTEALLREYDIGRWSGLTRAQIEAGWPAELAAFEAGRLDAPPGGERRVAFDRRVAEAARRVAGIVAGNGADRVLVVAHGGLIRVLARLQGLPDQHVSQLCGYEAEEKGGTLVLGRPVDLVAGAEHPPESVDRLAL